jgi:hypothetical protein
LPLECLQANFEYSLQSSAALVGGGFLQARIEFFGTGAGDHPGADETSVVKVFG